MSNNETFFERLNRYYRYLLSDPPLGRHSPLFTLPAEPFGQGDTERCIEIPWAVSCYHSEKRVLDVGYANAEDRYVSELLSLNIPQLFGIDMIPKNCPGIISVVGDIRNTSFPDDFFDLVFCISTIEHIGRDNSVYHIPYVSEDNEGDFKALQEIYRIVKPYGRVVVTVPYGKSYDYGWFIHYDDARLQRLVELSKFSIVLEDYFIYRSGWHKCDKSELASTLYQDDNAPAAAGLACILLEKR
ncbi:class I SAM-dependent methyltransferase [Methanofollis sp. UBA420]|uniref:class I SAM-dependent methyltransferase n=1 Tax=Methanofollis sp. UBA420 TaxID=1915514 RepID=UPI00316ABC58